MTIINASPDNIIQLGWEGEDRVTVLRFRYGEDWVSNGNGIFSVRVLRNGENQAYNAQMVLDDRENHCLLVTLTEVELSKKGTNEMQVVYSGEDFIKKSPVYRYYVSRSVDEAVDPPAQDVYTQIIESLSGLGEDIGDIQTDVRLIEGNIGNLADLTTEAKTDLVSAINEVNAKEGGGGSVTVDDALSTTSKNPVQNKVVTSAIQGKADIQTVSAIADAVQGLDSDVQGLQTAVQGKADTSTVTELSGTVSGLQTVVQSKADAQMVSDLSDTVTSLQTDKADKSYVDTQLAGKASTATATASADGLMSAQDKVKLETMIQRVASGAPIVVSSASAMTDTDQIYVLSTDGNWYYHNGTTWVSGGTYGAVLTDATLTQANVPADAKAVGDRLTAVEGYALTQAQIETLAGLLE